MSYHPSFSFPNLRRYTRSMVKKEYLCIKDVGEMRLIRLIRRIRTAGRHYLLMDGMHSCAYIPKHTYKYLNRLLERRLEENPKAENSLRFVWSRMGGSFVLAVNPEGVDMTQTHGLTRDTAGRILIPCPYIQQIYLAYGLEPEWCGKIYLGELRNRVNRRTERTGKAGRNMTNKADGPWLAMFAIHNS